MGYRDDEAAARARIAELERRLEKAHDRIDELENSDDEPVRRGPPRTRGPTTSATRRVGSVRYHPPATYFPLLRLYRESFSAAHHRRPRVKAPRSESVVAWLFYNAVKVPFLYFVWTPIFYLALCILMPWAGIVCLLGSAVLLPFVIGSRFTFGDEPPPGSGWFHGEVTEETAAIFLWILMSCTMQPLLIPCLTILTDPS